MCPNQGVGEKIRPVETKSQLFLKHFGGGLPLVRCPTIIDIISIQIRDEYNSKVLHNFILNMMRASDISVDRWEVWRVASIDALTREKAGLDRSGQGAFGASRRIFPPPCKNNQLCWKDVCDAWS